MSSKLVDTKQQFLMTLEYLIDSQVILPSEISRFAARCDDIFDPEYIRQDMEDWYRHLGLETIIRQKLVLSVCPFTREEIEAAASNNETIICIPKKVTRQQLGQLFRLHTWALTDPLQTSGTEPEDFWFRTSLSPYPTHLKHTGMEIKHTFNKEGKIHFSLERYLVFVARYLFLTRQLPDSQYWVWLPHKAYDRSGMLIAGFDRFNTLNVHGWMPQFSASFLGARYGYPPGKHTEK